MPQLLATALVPWISNALIAIGLPGLAFGATVGAIALGASYLLLAGGAYLLSQAFAPKTDVPKPEDGKYNLKQSVPPLSFILGRVKKGGDYVFLEEKGGRAHHITVMAAHHVKGYVEHWLHDEKVTLNGNGYVITPGRFDSNNDGVASVRILTRLGNDAETTYSQVVSAFPAIWTADHRGDGLSSVMMSVSSVSQERMQKVYPNNMPLHSAVIEGNDRLIDPRTGVAGYSENLAIFRAWHLTHPVGGKLSWNDLYLPDWSRAADVCDQQVRNRDGDLEPRYHGGFWFRANNDPVQVGRLIDQAADMVIYERADGKIGVHAGEFVEPDIRLTANDMLSISLDPNLSKSSSVLAMRGRYTNVERGYNTVDAAIYGNPYPSDDERTKTVDNTVVQRHNHIARLQKLAFDRANAQRVRIVAHYEPAEEVPYRRFVKVHYPPRLTEAVVEIIGQPVLSLRNLTIEFEGIVVPSRLYSFNAATEEGSPATPTVDVEREDVPLPADFDVTIQTEVVTGGASAAYGEATFSFQDESFVYEVEWQKSSGGEASSVIGQPEELTVRTNYLSDGTEYEFRARTWSGDVPSEWTDPIVLTATADAVPPGIVTSVSGVGGAGQITFNWTAPNSANYAGARLYWNAVDDFGTATLAATEYGAPSAADSRIVTVISAGTRYGWVVAINASGVAASAVATGAVTVT